MPGGISDFLFSPWGWLSLAAVAAGLELLLPGAYLIWIAAAALATALTAAILNLTIDGQLGVFAIWILVSLLAARRWQPRNSGTADNPLLNRRAEQLSGSVGVVSQAIRAGRGRVQLGDSEWIAEGADADPGTEVRIVGADGAILKVEPLKAEPPQPAA